MVKIKRQKARPHKRRLISPSRQPKNFRLAFRFILAVMLVAAVGIGVVMLKYMFIDSDCFNVRGVDVRFYDENNSLRSIPLGNISDDNIIGANIFLVDLKGLKDKVELEHPEFKDIVIRRALPNRLIVQARKRIPLAQIRSDRLYLLDEEGVFLPDIRKFAQENIPLVLGINITAGKSPRVELNITQQQNVDKALGLVLDMHANKRLAKYRFKTIDMTDSRNISFFLDVANVEIKIGDVEFEKRLDMLATVLEQLNQDINRVKYIDLRFEDPIVGPR